MRLAPAALALIIVASCGGATSQTPRSQPIASSPPPSSPAVVEASPAPRVADTDSFEPPPSASPEPSAAPTGPTAADRVRSMLDALQPIPPEEAVWLPMRILQVVSHATGELPAPSAPSVHGDTEIWSLVAPVDAQVHDTAAYAPSCDEVSRAEPRVACAVDSITVGPIDRVRLAFGWRRAAGEFHGDLALPLRALARLDTGACLLSAERTAHTLELRLRVADIRALSFTLALLSAAPRLSDIVLVQSEPAVTRAGPTLEAMLTWPTDRVDAQHADLHEDPWPARCDDHTTVGVGSAPRAPIVAILPITGERARGAIVAITRREWLITDGDEVGDARVTAVSDQGVYVRRGTNPRARARLIRFAAPLRHGQATSSPAPARVRIPLPPEPPAPLP